MRRKATLVKEEERKKERGVGERVKERLVKRKEERCGRKERKTILEKETYK